MRIEIRKAGKLGTYAEARGIAEELGGRNLRAPHHTVSQAGLVGELAISAGGVLLLDEVESFSTAALRVLRNTMELMHPESHPVLVLTHACERLPGRIRDLFGPREATRGGPIGEVEDA